jgi:thiol:disulfide interchange protein/DsbC/DsbD-like thiol-disulfide interchange protein
MLWLLTAWLMGLPLAADAQAPTHIAAQLVAEGRGQPGKEVTLALDMHPAHGWHGYWQNPGDAGLGMKLSWHLPDGASVGAPQYPVPETLVVGGLMNHVYQSDFALLMPFTVPANAVPGSTMPLSVKAEWLACTEQICVPESADLSLSLPISAFPASRDIRFDAWRSRLPAPLGSQAYLATTGDDLRLAIPFPASSPIDRPHFFATDDRVVDYAAPQGFARDGDTLIVTLKRAKGAAAPTTFNGVLRLNPAGDGVSIAATPGPVPTGGLPIETSEGPAAAPSSSLPLLILAAIAGGLLLNIMPCVFPILSLKALSLARAGECEAEARIEGVAYAAGVIVTCAGLGALLLALRAGGSQVGWAFQLQEPGVVAVLLLLAVGVTANLLGLFEFLAPTFASQAGMLDTKSTARRGFVTGLFAAFVATPCTGPFMASAMGAALLLPVMPAMVLFVALGFGIALPFLAIAYIPALRRLLPRPGPWMVWFKKAMAVPMGLTALGLVWLASRLGGNSFAGTCVVLAIVMLAVLANLGRVQRRTMGGGKQALAMMAVLTVCGAIILPRTIHAPGAEAQGLLPSQPFSQQALDKALAEGHPVFAYFTADWCLSCKVNERVAIERESTRDAFAKAGVVVLKGDWTRRDAAITRYLTARGAAGVPLYVWYGRGAQNAAPKTLPQVLGSKTLINLAAN